MLKELLLFARSKPADEVYEYNQPDRCPIAQYLIAANLASKPNVFPDCWDDLAALDSTRSTPIDPRLSGNDGGPISRGEQTWGALAQRLEFEDFLDFARSKRPSETYDYVSNGHCAFAQYLRSIGVQDPRVVPGGWSEGPYTRDSARRYDQRIDVVACNSQPKTGKGEDWNWGALVKRLEAART